MIPLGDRLVALDRIREIDCHDFVARGRIAVRVDDRTFDLDGADAFDLLLRVCPRFLEGKRLRWRRHAWALHNLVGHPLLQLLAWTGQRRLGLFVHDATVPRPLQRR